MGQQQFIPHTQIALFEAVELHDPQALLAKMTGQGPAYSLV